MTRQLVIGTAGHIDHGKSTLVRALTGVDPDRLPEEQSRGMTIDLGFAHTRCDNRDLYFVDVPGHERFIRNMVAGATGIDLALLVVAADDAVMPQTREHVEILQVLGIRDLIVAISKADLVDDEWCAAVGDEVTSLVTERGFAAPKIILTASTNNRGIAELRSVLCDWQSTATATKPPTWFRMPIDRVFSVPGRGTVVTGTVMHGNVARDDELTLFPAGRTVRVREMQTHSDDTVASAGRMRLAINLPGVATDDVARGHELATPDYLEPIDSVGVELSRLRILGKRPRQNFRVRFHIATQDVLAELVLVDGPANESVVDDVSALVKLSDPIVATHGQRFAIRDESGQKTLGGGRVLRAAKATLRTLKTGRDWLTKLAGDHERDRLEATIALDRWCDADHAKLAARAGLLAAQAINPLNQSLVGKKRVHQFQHGTETIWIHESSFVEIAKGVTTRLKKTLAANPRQHGIARNELPNWLPADCPLAFRPLVAEALITTGHLNAQNDRVVPPGAAGSLPPADQKLYDAIVAELANAGMKPPVIAALTATENANPRRVSELLKRAEDQRELVRLTPTVYLHQSTWEHARTATAAALENAVGLTVSEIRDIVASSRKVVVPLVEKFDAIGLTRREGDTRVLNNKDADR